MGGEKIFLAPSWNEDNKNAYIFENFLIFAFASHMHALGSYFSLEIETHKYYLVNECVM